MTKREHALAESLGYRFFHSLEAHFAGFQVDDVDKGDIGDNRRQESVFDHLDVGDADILDHQEGRRAHDRGHQLAIGRARDLHRAGFFGRKSGFFHQGNRKCAGGHHIGNRGPGNQAGQPGRDDCGFGRSATKVSQSGKRGTDEVVARTGRFQQRAEKNEHEHHPGGDPEGNPEHPFGGQPKMGHALAQAGALVRDDIRHIGTEKGIDDKHGGHDHQWRSQRAAGGLQQNDHSDNGHDQIQLGRRRPGVATTHYRK